MNILIELYNHGYRFLVFSHRVYNDIDHYTLIGKAKVHNFHQDKNTFKIILNKNEIINAQQEELNKSHKMKKSKKMNLYN